MAPCCSMQAASRTLVLAGSVIVLEGCGGGRGEGGATAQGATAVSSGWLAARGSALLMGAGKQGMMVGFAAGELPGGMSYRGQPASPGGGVVPVLQPWLLEGARAALLLRARTGAGRGRPRRRRRQADLPQQRLSGSRCCSKHPSQPRRLRAQQERRRSGRRPAHGAGGARLGGAGGGREGGCWVRGAVDARGLHLSLTGHALLLRGVGAVACGQGRGTLGPGGGACWAAAPRPCIV